GGRHARRLDLPRQLARGRRALADELPRHGLLGRGHPRGAFPPCGAARRGAPQDQPDEGDVRARRSHQGRSPHGQPAWGRGMESQARRRQPRSRARDPEQAPREETMTAVPIGNDDAAPVSQWVETTPTLALADGSSARVVEGALELTDPAGRLLIRYD